MTSSPTPPAPGQTRLELREALSGNPERRLVDLLAFALGVERGADAAAVEELRRRADADLTAEAFRRLHNESERIRQEAVLQHLGGMRGGPGFLRLVAANLVAVLLGGLLLLWWAGAIDPLAHVMQGVRLLER